MEKGYGILAEKNQGMIFNVLRSYTEGEVRKIVSAVDDADGLNLWRNMCQHYEPETTVKQGMAMNDLLEMVKLKNKDPTDTRRAIVQLEENKRRVEEVTGKIRNGSRPPHRRA